MNPSRVDRVIHLQQCPAGFVDLADVFLVAEGIRFPAHSQQLALQSRFVQELLMSTGPYSWQDLLTLDTALENYTSLIVAMLLSAIYLPDAVHISSAEEAWRLYRLADQLECPSILQHCKNYINSSSGAALLNTSAATIDWFMAADKLGLAGLKQQCADQIAKDYLAVSDSSQLLPSPQDPILLVMQSMAEQNRKYEGEVMARVKAVLQKCSGRAVRNKYTADDMR